MSEADEATAAEGTDASQSTPQRSGRGRAITAMVLIVVASLVLPLAALTVWTRNLMLNTDRFVETVAPLPRDPAVREAVALQVSTALIDALDVKERAQDALPKRAQFLAAPIAAGATELVHSATLRVLETEQFQKLWDFASRRAHGQIVAALTGRDSDAITNEDGKVVLELGPVAVQVAKQLSRVGIAVPDNVDVERMNVRFVLIDSEDLASVQTYTKVLDQLAWVLPVLAFILYLIAVVISPRKRVTLVRAGIGATVAMLISVVGYGLIRTLYLDSLPGSGDHEAGAVIFDTVTRYMQRGLRALLIVGVLVWFIAWLAGPSRPARAVRRQWDRMIGKATDGLGESSSLGPVNGWVADHVGLLRGLVLAALAVVLVTWERPTGKVVLLLVVIGLVGFGVIQMLAAGGQRADAEAVPTST